MSTGQWEDCPCCGAATYPDGSIQWDGTRVLCGCNCWVSIDEDEYDDPVGYITMGDDPCSFYALCNREEHWEAEARRACAQPTPGYTPAVRRVDAWETRLGQRFHTKDEAYRQAVSDAIAPRASQSSRRFHKRCWTRGGGMSENRTPEQERWGREYLPRLYARLASFLQAQDRKHGGGS